MEKKEYIKPGVNVMNIETSTVIASSSSSVKKAQDADYDESNVSKFRDDDDAIFGD